MALVLEHEWRKVQKKWAKKLNEIFWWLNFSIKIYPKGRKKDRKCSHHLIDSIYFSWHFHSSRFTKSFMIISFFHDVSTLTNTSAANVSSIFFPPLFPLAVLFFHLVCSSCACKVKDKIVNVSHFKDKLNACRYWLFLPIRINYRRQKSMPSCRTSKSEIVWNEIEWKIDRYFLFLFCCCCFFISCIILSFDRHFEIVIRHRFGILGSHQSAIRLFIWRCQWAIYSNWQNIKMISCTRPILPIIFKSFSFSSRFTLSSSFRLYTFDSKHKLKKKKRNRKERNRKSRLSVHRCSNIYKMAVDFVLSIRIDLIAIARFGRWVKTKWDELALHQQ